MTYQRVPSYGPKPDLTHAERMTRLEALIAHVGKELDLILPGHWEVTFDFNPKRDGDKR